MVLLSPVKPVPTTCSTPRFPVGSPLLSLQARIVMLLRDPVARAYSHYLHEQRRGFETLPLEEALSTEPERLAGEEERLHSPTGITRASHTSTTRTWCGAGTTSSLSATWSTSTASKSSSSSQRPSLPSHGRATWRHAAI